MDLIDLLAQQLSGDQLTKVSKQIGADEGATSRAASAAIPLLVSALARNSAQPKGAQSLFDALERDHDGSILDDLPGLLGDPQAANGAGILKHVLGDRRGPVENGLAQSTGMDSGSAGQLLQILAPVVMGALGQTKREQGLDANGLAALLGSQQQSAQSASPDVIGLLGDLLDADHDGSALDDIAGIAGSLLGGR